ncbi:RhoGAP domain containing protein [Entamoeba histolytica KU27]|uniref:RhoGAP domain containing protein n=1 Tax=Entamoeba histolytica KU27 TaxID=885311 RepID=M2REF5_ENTHI|nr:RhoGAP domain containing protein [Entamoeba histolytica KU27]
MITKSCGHLSGGKGSMRRIGVIEEMKRYKEKIKEKLSIKTDDVETLKVIREMINFQMMIQQMRRRIELTEVFQKDKKDLMKISKVQQDMHIREMEKAIEKGKERYEKRIRSIDMMETFFNKSEIVEELAKKMLGERLYVNIVSKGENLGNGESRNEGENEWKKVNILIYQNLIFLLKPGSDTVLAIIYISNQYKLVYAENQRRRYMLKVGQFVLSAESKEVMNLWSECITTRKMWYQDKVLKKKVVMAKRKVPMLGEVGELARMSMSILTTVQISPHIEKEEVIGVSLQELSQREGYQQMAPIVYRLLIEYLTDNCVDIEGILRLSGGSDEVHRLEILITRRTFSLQDLKDIDPHVITSTLKGLFRRLPIPLIPSNINSKIESLINQKVPYFKLVISIKEHITTLKEVLPEHFEVFKLLCKLFTEIINRKPTNKMDLTNVLTCFVESVKCSPSIFSCALQNQGIFFDSLLIILNKTKSV